MFYRPLEIEMLAQDIGLDMSRVRLVGSAYEIWTSVLLEADREGAVADLVARAEERAPAAKPVLRFSLDAYRRDSRRNSG
jgi:hypothetical protein